MFTAVAPLHHELHSVGVWQRGGKVLVLDVGAVLGDGAAAGLQDENAADSEPVFIYKKGCMRVSKTKRPTQLFSFNAPCGAVAESLTGPLPALSRGEAGPVAVDASSEGNAMESGIIPHCVDKQLKPENYKILRTSPRSSCMGRS